jgi:hypothetical protein
MTILIKSNKILRINSNLNINNNFTITIEPGGQFIVDGDLFINNNVKGQIDGSLYVTGNLTIVGGGSTEISGSGEIIVDGTISDPNNELPPALINFNRWLIVNHGDWSLNTSWSKTQGGIPAVTPPNNQSIVHIPNTFTTAVNMDSEINKLDIKTGGTLNILAGKTLTVTDNTATGITSNGTINIYSDATGTGGLIYNGLSAVSANCQKYITANQYHYVSSPLTSAPVTCYNMTGYGTINPNFYRFDETESNSDWMYGWKQVSSGNLSPGTGYAIYTDDTRAYTLNGGTLINQNYNVAITNTPTAGGSKTWNLIGNPFPCNVNADSFIDANDNSTVFTGALYFWDDDGTNGSGYNSSDYLVYTKGGGTSGGNGSTLNGIIAPLQAFFVQANTGGNMLFGTTMKTNTTSTFMKSYPNSENEKLQQLRLSLTSQEGVYNDILIKFTLEANEGMDSYDGFKLKGNAFLSFYTLLNDEPYAIQGLPLIHDKISVDLGIDANIQSTYTIRAEQFVNLKDDIMVYLEDAYKNTTINLRSTEYTFNMFGSSTDRFVLHFVNTKSSPNHTGSDLKTAVFSSGETLYINSIDEQGFLTLYDITGKIVFSSGINPSGQEFNPDVPTGYYIAKITYNNRVESYKVYMD